MTGELYRTPTHLRRGGTETASIEATRSGFKYFGFFDFGKIFFNKITNGIQQGLNHLSMKVRGEVNESWLTYIENDSWRGDDDGDWDFFGQSDESEISDMGGESFSAEDEEGKIFYLLIIIII